MTNLLSVANVVKNNTNPPAIEQENKPVKMYPVRFKANENDQFIRNNRQTTPVITRVPIQTQQDMMIKAMEEQKKKERNKNIKNNIITGLGALASLAVVAYFGNEMLAKRRASQEARKIQEAMASANGTTAGDTIMDMINKCKDLKLKRLMVDEYSKGFGASEKKIRALFTLAGFEKGQLKKIDVENARKVLDQKVIGMDEAKDQVINYLKYRNRCIEKGIDPGPFVLALDGPPGTAKTTLAKAIAEICGMPSKEISMAGMTGKAQLKGSESVYTGATWGDFADAQIEHKRNDICYILDEIEKFGTSEHNGKPDDVLLSALDKRHSILDDFLGCEIDLNNSIIITTSNDIGKINEILRSRLGTPVSIQSYDEAIKRAVTKFKAEHCIKDHKLDDVVQLSDDAINEILRRNNDAKGGREVTEEIEKVIKMVFSNEAETATKEEPFIITADIVRKYLPRKVNM